MGRTVAVVWHASFSLVAGVLFFFFVLPRTPELLGHTSHSLGTALRIVTGTLIGLAALPVVFTLLRTRKPELGTPALALHLRTSSIALHVLAGTLLVGAAVSEIWLTLTAAGQWLFGVYGAAAATATLGIFTFYLAFVAERPPLPTKPKTTADCASRGRTSQNGAHDDDPYDEAGSAQPTGTDDEPVVTSEAEADPELPAAPDTKRDADDNADDDRATPATSNKLQNRRPTGKGTLLGRHTKARSGVALED